MSIQKFLEARFSPVERQMFAFVLFHSGILVIQVAVLVLSYLQDNQEFLNNLSIAFFISGMVVMVSGSLIMGTTRKEHLEELKVRDERDYLYAYKSTSMGAWVLFGLLFLFYIYLYFLAGTSSLIASTGAKEMGQFLLILLFVFLVTKHSCLLYYYKRG